jgi:hypothetical protein
MTTGSSKVDMMVSCGVLKANYLFHIVFYQVVRLSSIINALQNNYTDVTGEELRYV